MSRAAPAHQNDEMAGAELVSDAASRRIWSTPAAVGPTQGVQLATMQKLIQYWGRITI